MENLFSIRAPLFDYKPFYPQFQVFQRSQTFPYLQQQTYLPPPAIPQPFFNKIPRLPTTPSFGNIPPPSSFARLIIPKGEIDQDILSGMLKRTVPVTTTKSGSLFMQDELDGNNSLEI